MASYRLDRDAREDLQSIWDYIAEHNPDAADRLLDRLLRAIRLLGSNSEMGQLRPELADRLRSFTVGAYVIYYRSTSNGVEVVRIIHGARDIDARF